MAERHFVYPRIGSFCQAYLRMKPEREDEEVHHEMALMQGCPRVSMGSLFSFHISPCFLVTQNFSLDTCHVSTSADGIALAQYSSSLLARCCLLLAG